jgi:hypothetical protein
MYDHHVYLYHRHMTLRSIVYLRKKHLNNLARKLQRDLLGIRCSRADGTFSWVGSYA